MRYKIRLLHSAEKEMEKLPKATHTRISNKILPLENNPRPQGTKKLSDREEYRLRVGEYRVLYTIDDEGCVVTIVAVTHRREAYR